MKTGETPSTPPNSPREPLLEANPNRFVMFPIQYNDMWEMYKKHMASFGPQRK